MKPLVSSNTSSREDGPFSYIATARASSSERRSLRDCLISSRCLWVWSTLPVIVSRSSKPERTPVMLLPPSASACQRNRRAATVPVVIGKGS